MFVKLRIVFTILAAICVAAIIPVGMLFDFVPAIGVAVLALLFFGLMLLCKSKQGSTENPTDKTNTDQDSDR